jgi:short-subunit dehydrogenase
MHESIKAGVDKIFADTKRIVVLVNNAGYGLFGAVEDLNMNGIIAQFDTNFFGVIRLTKLVLPIMRNQMKGTIVNISSMVGRVGMPLNSVYVASKFALEGFSESIRYELRKFGINVILIEPGIVKSKFLNNIHKTGHEASDSPYSSLLQKRLDKFKSISENNSTSPHEVADTVLKAVMSEKPNFRYTVGVDAETVMNMKETLSHEEFERWIWNSFIEG